MQDATAMSGMLEGKVGVVTYVTGGSVTVDDTYMAN
jgi:hypothetical protein